MITLSNNTKVLALLHQVEEIYGKVYTNDSLWEMVLYWRIKVSKGAKKDQESIQSSTTPDLGYQWVSITVWLCLGYICLTTSIRCPYDVQITVSVRPPQGDLAIIVRIYWHCGLYDFV